MNTDFLIQAKQAASNGDLQTAIEYCINAAFFHDASKKTIFKVAASCLQRCDDQSVNQQKLWRKIKAEYEKGNGLYKLSAPKISDSDMGVLL